MCPPYFTVCYRHHLHFGSLPTWPVNVKDRMNNVVSTASSWGISKSPIIAPHENKRMWFFYHKKKDSLHKSRSHWAGHLQAEFLNSFLVDCALSGMVAIAQQLIL